MRYSDDQGRKIATVAVDAVNEWKQTTRAAHRLVGSRADEPSPYLKSLRAGLGDLSWSEGLNLTIGRFWATGLDNMEATAPVLELAREQ
jgi:hypothetical protein